MPELTIDNQKVTVPDGATVLDAARALSIDIPTLCHRDGYRPGTSCMVCVVRINGSERLRPACATVAAEGMVVESETPQVRQARRTNLELLLSDHVGDCMAPCHSTCPAGMNIPLMIRRIAAGDNRGALETIKADIALPAVLGRICPAPCEKACRRGVRDEPVAICLLKRYPADADLASGQPYLPPRADRSGKRVAIVGAGPAGLAAAYYLLQQGHACTLFDDRQAPGGMLRYGVPADLLPRDVLDGEIDIIRRLGAEFRPGVRVGRDLPFARLREDFDAVLVATGEARPEAARPSQAGPATPLPPAFGSEAQARRGEDGPSGPGEGDSPAEAFGLVPGKTGIQTDRDTLRTSVAGVFAAGAAIRPTRMAVRAVADGKAAAASIGQLLAGAVRRASRPPGSSIAGETPAVPGPPKPFTVHVGKLQDGEIDAFMVGASPAPRVKPAAQQGKGGSSALRASTQPTDFPAADAAPAPAAQAHPGFTHAHAGFTDAQARAEALRCMHCDCRKADNCRLRDYSAEYQASPRRYHWGQARADRRRFTQQLTHPDIIYEPGKCIDCGLCVRIAEAAAEPLGLSFVGRGFNVRVAVPFNEPLAKGLAKAARQCVEACPTGALAMKE